jgi:ribokinase
MAFDVVVIGSASIDVLVKTDARTVRIEGIHHGQTVDERLLAYPLGSKLLIQKLAFFPGGAGTNVCSTFARFGLNTAFIGRLGSDSHGRSLQDWLHERNVAFLGQIGGVTGYSLLLTCQAEDRTILSFKGCNNDLELADLPPETRRACWLYGASMLETAFRTQERLFQHARRRGIHTAYNPNPYLCCDGLEPLRAILRHTEVLILNREEASLLAVAQGEEPLALAARLAEQGPAIVAVTDGERGATIVSRSDWGTGQWHVAPARDLRVVDTTGAGDAFGSGFVAGLNLGKSAPEAALLGVLNAESVLQVYGAKADDDGRHCDVDAWLRAERRQPRHEIATL